MLRCGVWLTTSRNSGPVFFIPGVSVLLHEEGEELTVTENQVMDGFDSLLTRIFMRLGSYETLKKIIVLASGDGCRKTPGTWHKTWSGRVLAQVEEAYELPDTGLFQQQLLHNEWRPYDPKVKWTLKRQICVMTRIPFATEVAA